MRRAAAERDSRAGADGVSTIIGGATTWGIHLFQQIKQLSPDAILGLMAKFRADPSHSKVDLGVGVYRNLDGETPVLDAVRRAEREVLAAETTKSYVAAAGREEFNTAVEELVLGTAHPARRERRARTTQTPGGCGALRVGAELIRAAAPGISVHVSDPTWGNHTPLLGSSGLGLERYPYYDPVSHRLEVEAMLDRLSRAPEGDAVLIHACCHNPTGADLAPADWRAVAEVLQRRRLVPFLDVAYQGFAEGLEEDVAAVRMIVEQVPESLIAISFSKNLGLYRERTGALIAVAESESRADAVRSHMLQIARSIYSMPPDHGAAIAARILMDPALKRDWIVELDAMRDRITDMRALLARRLIEATGDESYDFIRAQHGMFSLLGVSPAAVDRLREQRHIYMLQDSRMNLAGITPGNVDYVAEAIAAEHRLEDEPTVVVARR
ncbi:MAG TPA: amino acid aminotransferase [Steroidobacteraceae bacterium]|jgi:aspartate aminotransferase|nr:amino acid aminotransferase [Steroidobacteraceae bacterium]